MQNVVGLVFEKQSYQTSEKLLLYYFSEDAGAGYRYAVAEHLKQTVVVEVHLGDTHDLIHGASEEINDTLDHWLLLQPLLVLPCSFRRGSCIFCVEGGEGVVVDDRHEEGKGGKGQLAVLVNQLKHNLDVGLAGDHLNHLLAVHDQVVLVDGLYQHRAEVLDDRTAVGALPPALLPHLLEYRSQDLDLDCQFLGL